MAESAKAERRFLSLGQWLFILLSVFLVLPLCAFQLWGYYQARKYLTMASFRNVRSVASLEASQMTLYVQHAEDLFGSAVSADGRLPGLVRGLSAADGEARRRAGDELRALRHKMSDLAPVDEIQIISPTGALLASTLGSGGPGGGAGEPACMPMRTGGPVIDGAARDGRDAILRFASAVDGGAGEALGTVCARVRFDFGKQAMRSRRDGTVAAASYLLDERGDVVSDTVAGDRHGADPTLFGGGNVIPALNHPWEGRYVSGSGAEALAAYEPVRLLGWGVLAQEPVAIALAPLRRLEWVAGAGGAALLLLVGVAAVFSWKKVANPLQSLSRTAERIASGATGETVTPGGSRETAELAESFNRMSSALWQSQHTLEQRIAERTRELRESQELAERLLNSIDHRVIAVDREYRVVKANAAALRMYGPDLVGMRCYQVFEGRSTPCEECAAARTFATGRPASEERSEFTGSIREAVEVETYPVLGSGGEVHSVIEIARIVTAEKQVQMQMMHQQKMAAFGLLAAGMAHDIGNPLAAIESQLQIARQQPDRQSESLAVVSKEISRISRMLRELIDFTRRRRDAVMLVSVNQVVEDVIRLLSHDPRARTVSVDPEPRRQAPRHSHHGRPSVPGAPESRLERPRRHAGRRYSGVRDFLAAADGSFVRVRDTGHGIPADRREHLFEPFFTTKAARNGTGLGLFVSKSIVESMGGDLALEHTDGRGTVFAIFLPVDPGPEDSGSV